MFTCDETLKFCYGYPVARQHTYTLEAIRPKLREALQHLADGDDVILTRHGKPIAALITPDDHARLRALPRNQERPMHVISIYNQAGGAGKTTLTRDLDGEWWRPVSGKLGDLVNKLKSLNLR